MSEALVLGPGHGLCPQRWPQSLFFTFVVQDHVILKVHFRGLGVLLVTVHQQDGALATRAPGPGALGISEGQKTLSVALSDPISPWETVLFFCFLFFSLPLRLLLSSSNS